MKRFTTLILIFILLTGCQQWKTNRAKRLIDKAERLDPDLFSRDSIETKTKVFVPTLVPETKNEMIFTIPVTLDTVMTTEDEHSITTVIKETPDIPEELKPLLSKVETKYIVRTVVKEVRDTVETEVTVKGEQTTIFEERIIYKIGWKVYLLIGVLLLALLYLILKKK